MKHLYALPRLLLKILKQAAVEWWVDDSPRLAASLAFYTVFSLAPMLIIAVTIAGVLFGKAAVQGEIVSHMESFAGKETASIVQTILINARTARSGTFATVLSILFILAGATAVFAELQHALNRVWEVRASEGIKSAIVTRILSFLIVFGVGFLLTAALLVSTGVALAGSYIGIDFIQRLFVLLNIVLPFVVITVLFAMFYKVLPDVNIGWGDVWVGATITAFLFVLGNYLLSFYVTRGALASAYGVAGSLVAFLMWIYYSAQIFLLGAEITHVYAKTFGTRITPARGAVSISRDQKQAKREYNDSKKENE